MIRESISQPTIETDGLKGISWRVDHSPPSEIGVSIVTQPREFRSFMVFLTLDKSQNHVSAVALPPPNAGSEFFHILAQGWLASCFFWGTPPSPRQEAFPLEPQAGAGRFGWPSLHSCRGSLVSVWLWLACLTHPPTLNR